jgi:hypothetical protein
LPLSSDVWISEAVLERLAPGRYVARVKVETSDGARIDMFALPSGYRPTANNARRLAEDLREHYETEGI